MAVVDLEPGYFRALHRPEALWFGGFWRLGWAQAKGDGRLGEMTRGGIRIRRFGIGRSAAPALGAVPGRTCQDA